MNKISDCYSPDYISRRLQFRGTNMSGFNTVEYSVYGTPIEGVYRVFSYNTLIAEYYDGVWYINETRYSNITSKHQSYVKAGLRNIYEHDTIHLYHQPWYINTLFDRVDSLVARQRIERIKREQKSVLISKYKVTGRSYGSTKNFKPIITDNYWLMRGINLWCGTKWQMDASGKWLVIQRVSN